MYDFKFADIGEGIHEGTILKWNFKVGDKVNEGDVLAVVETDKVNAELPAPASGYILKLGPAEGQTIHVGDTVALIGASMNEQISESKPVEQPKVEIEVASKPYPVAKEGSKPTTSQTNTTDFKFADIGEGIHEGTILKWNFKVGDKVNEGDVLAVVETDKVNAELPSPASGYILKLGPSEGQTIHVGETVALIGSSMQETTQPTQAPKPQKVDEKEDGAGVVGSIAVTSDIIESSNETHEVVSVSNKVLATPVARSYAKELNVDINQVKGTGPDGRVTKEDILLISNSGKTPTPTPKPQVVQPAVLPAAIGDEVVKISRLRKAISNQMTKSKAIIPHCVLMDEFNVNALVEFRNQAKTLAESKESN